MKTLEERKNVLYDKLERYDAVMEHLRLKKLETAENLNKFDEPFGEGFDIRFIDEEQLTAIEKSVEAFFEKYDKDYVISSLYPYIFQ